jgi:hypothetical protein
MPLPWAWTRKCFTGKSHYRVRYCSITHSSLSIARPLAIDQPVGAFRLVAIAQTSEVLLAHPKQLCPLARRPARYPSNRIQ